MGQVPEKKTNVLLIGSGRLARHLSHYIELESSNLIELAKWNRHETAKTLDVLIQRSQIVFLAISDDALWSFYDSHPALKSKTCVHFSGAKFYPDIIGLHPLCTFSNSLYDLSTYRAIPFVCDRADVSLSSIWPGIQNSLVFLRPELKAAYHTYVSMAGNFTTLLWEKAFTEFQETLNLPPQTLDVYLQMIVRNLLLHASQSQLTGPLTRNDETTIRSHLDVLKTDPYLSVYRAFIEAYEKSKRESP